MRMQTANSDNDNVNANMNTYETPNDNIIDSSYYSVAASVKGKQYNPDDDSNDMRNMNATITNDTSDDGGDTFWENKNKNSYSVNSGVRNDEYLTS